MGKVMILTGEPVVSCVAEMALNWEGIRDMGRWVKERRPECLPDGYDPDRVKEDDGDGGTHWVARTTENEGSDQCVLPEVALFPHDMMRDSTTHHTRDFLSDNELLVELAARTCYYSFGLKAGKKDNASYIANTQSGNVKHASIMYHAKMSFFIAGISHRMARDLIRNYVGADRDFEGSPSHESTRYTEHSGIYVAPPHILNDPYEMGFFQNDTQENHNSYTDYIERQVRLYKERHGAEPAGIERKRIYESASMRQAMSGATSLVWTTNPVALRKLFAERCAPEADVEFQRLANKWKRVCLERWPNLFPGMV